MDIARASCHRPRNAKRYGGTVAKNRLRIVLSHEGLSKRELARASGLGRYTVAKIHAGRLAPAPGTEFKIVAGLNRLLDENRYRVEDVFPRRGDRLREGILEITPSGELTISGEPSERFDVAEAEGLDGDPTTDYLEADDEA